MQEEKETVETSEESETQTDETQTDETTTSEETEEQTTETEESADLEEENVEEIEETELLKGTGFERYVGKGGIEQLIKDYQEGQKGFTEIRQTQALLDKIAQEAGFESGKQLMETIQKNPAALKKVIEGDKTPPTDPLETSWQDYSKTFETEWTKDQFGKFVEIIGRALGINSLQDNLGVLASATGESIPIILKEYYKEFKDDYKEQHKSEPLAQFAELKEILKKNPGLYAKARKEDQNPMQAAYKIWILENKSEELLSFLAKAMQKKGVDEITAMNNAKKVLKTSKEEITKDISQLSEQEFRKLPKEKRDEFMRKLIPSIDKALIGRS